VSPQQPGFTASQAPATSLVTPYPNRHSGNGAIEESIDDVVNQILERRSARLTGNPVPDLGAVKEAQVRAKTSPLSQPRPGILRSLDLECSTVPLGDPVVSTRGEAGYVSPFTPLETPDEHSPPYLVDERKSLTQLLSDLESAVRALDAPSMDYSDLPYEEDAIVADPLPRSRGLPIEEFEEDVAEAVIRFRGTELAAMDTSLLHGRSSDPYLVFCQNGKELGRTDVVEHDLNPVWKPLQLVFRDKWTPVSVQCWDKDTMTSDDFIGENDVPVSDLLTAHRVIHLFSKGKSTGKITVDSVTMRSKTTANASQPEKPSPSRPAPAPTTPVVQTDTQKWSLKLSLKSCAHLPKMDLMGTCDAYVVAKIGRETFRSSTIKGSYSPIWNESFEFELDGAHASDKLVLSVYDWDRVSLEVLLFLSGSVFDPANSLPYVQNSRDDFIGEVKLPVTSLASEFGEIKTLQLKQSDPDKVHPVSLGRWELSWRCMMDWLRDEYYTLSDALRD